MDDQSRKLRCVLMVALAAILMHALLPATFIGGLTGLKTADMIEHSSDLMHKILVLGGMVIGLMAASLIIMLLVSAINASLASHSAKAGCKQLRDKPETEG